MDKAEMLDILLILMNYNKIGILKNSLVLKSKIFKIPKKLVS